MLSRTAVKDILSIEKQIVSYSQFGVSIVDPLK